MIENNERELQQKTTTSSTRAIASSTTRSTNEAQTEQQKLEMENLLNERDNDTKLTIAMLQSQLSQEETPSENSGEKEALLEKMRV